jgi:hypothetical protein
MATSTPASGGGSSDYSAIIADLKAFALEQTKVQAQISKNGMEAASGKHANQSLRT